MSCCKESQTHQPWGWAGLLLSQQSCTVWGELLRGILLSSKTLFFILLYFKTNKQTNHCWKKNYFNICWNLFWKVDTLLDFKFIWWTKTSALEHISVCLSPMGELKEKYKQEKWGKEEKWRRDQGKGVTASNVFSRLLFQSRGGRRSWGCCCIEGHLPVPGFGEDE